MGVTTITFYVINHSSLVSFGDFVFGVDEMASDSVERFQMHLDTGFPNYSGDIVGHIAYIWEGDTAFDDSVSLGRGGSTSSGSGRRTHADQLYPDTLKTF